MSVNFRLVRVAAQLPACSVQFMYVSSHLLLHEVQLDP